jgi:hypothetical protein
MASAISLHIQGQEIEDGQVKLSLTVLFSDTVLGVKESQAVYVKFSPSATVQQIENAMEAAIIDQAKSYWPTMVLGVTDIIMYDIKRGN